MGKRGPLAGTNKREAPTGIRFDPELRARLEAARTVSGLSFSEEVSSRLRASFGSVQSEDPVTRGLAAQIGHALDIIEERENEPWHLKERSWLFACHAILEILSYYEPGGYPEVSDNHPLLIEIAERGMPEFVISEMKGELAKEFIEPAPGDRRLGSSSVGQRAARTAIAVYEARADAADIVKLKLQMAGWEGEALRELKRAPDLESRLTAEFIENPPTEADIDGARADYEKARDAAKQRLSSAWKGDPAKGDDHDQ